MAQWRPATAKPAWAAALACACSLWLASTGARGAAPRFYPDDPIPRDPESQDASQVQAVEISGGYDAIENSFLGAGEEADRRALNVNTIGEVPDSSWFINRVRPPSRAGNTFAADALRPATEGGGPAPGTWTVTGRKSEGVMPGFTIRDSRGDIYWIKFDPKSFPEMASGAEAISTRFFHAFGYHVPENYVAFFKREALVIEPGATMRDEDGRRRPLTDIDLDAIMEDAARQPDGTYRVLASRNLPGRPVGAFRYYGTRPDDPNDIFPHEHRRELRGLAVFSAWLNHDEVRSTNSLDTLVPAGDGRRQIVRHHLLDFGSTLGSGSVKAHSRRAGNEYLWESRPTLITMLTLGLYVRPWIRVDYPEIPAVGRFESTYYRAEDWKPEYPNPAFKNARPDDRFWAARIVAAFDDEAVAAIVRTGLYTDPRATEYVTRTLLERRSKVLRAWLNVTNPIVDLALAPSGALTFDNAAELAGVAKPAERYTVQWSRFDNATGTQHDTGAEQTLATTTAQVPAALLDARPEYISARLRAFQSEHPEWSQPLVAFFRRTADGWALVGLERNP
jgi:hypothetical protein